MKKLLLLGCPGSGKSTFARALHRRTGLPLYHLDTIWWRPDGTHVSREAFDEDLGAILRQEAYILDGDYSRTYEVRIKACDTVIFLDYGEAVCLAGIRDRVGQSRSDMPWREAALDEELEDLVRRYDRDNRPVILSLLARYPEKKAYIFTCRAQTEAFLESLPSSGSPCSQV